MDRLRRQATKFFGKAALAAVALGGIVLFAGAPGARAQGRDDYNFPSRQVQYTDWRLHEAIEHFGYYSPQANYWRHERHEALERARHARHEYYEHRHRRDRDWDHR